MTSSSPETSTHTTGAHRAPRSAPRTPERRPPVRYEPYLDGLFTYCLSVLCDHDAATEVLGEVLALSERQYSRAPSDAGERKAWLYALARWACLRRLTEQRKERQGAHAVHRARPGEHRADGAGEFAPPDERPGQRTAGAPDFAADAVAPGTGVAPGAEGLPDPVAVAAAEERRRHELAQLAWPEAAGTTPEQREILELAVRHQLGPREVAAVLSMEPAAARELLASAACEVERTRAALAVVETGNCPSVARLTGDHQVLLSAALRRELVRHVDDCPRCRRIAERAEASAPWPGSRPAPAPGLPSRPASPAVLPLIDAPRAAAYTAMVRAPRRRASAPRFGRNGFPMDPKDRAARRDRLRARAVTTTVVATVVAAPVLALWAAYRGAPPTGEGHDGPSVSAPENDAKRGGEGGAYERYENAGNARARPGPDFGVSGGSGAGRVPDVSVEVISEGPPAPPSVPGRPAPGRLAVEARSSGGATTITLTASGAPVSWSARTGAHWLRLSSSAGTLAPGESVTIRVLVDYRNQPGGSWTARIVLDPTGAVVRLDGYGRRPSAQDPTRPGRPGRPDHHPGPGRPTDPRPSDPGPTGPSGPGPSTPADPPPSDPTTPPPSSDPTTPPPSDPPPSDPPVSDPPPADPGPPSVPG